MSIELHCPQCQKLIRAPDDAGGRRGKCPYCKASVYIPTPVSPDDEIKIAEVDEAEEHREEEMRREAARYAANLDHGDVSAMPDEADRRPAPPVDMDYDEEIERFIRSMHASKLDDADAAAARLKRGGAKAHDHVEHMLLDDIPPEFDGIPAPLAKGFLKRLLSLLE